MMVGIDALNTASVALIVLILWRWPRERPLSFMVKAAIGTCIASLVMRLVGLLLIHV